MQTATIDETSQGERLDTYICQNFKIPSRSFLQNHWEKIVSLNGSKIKPAYKVRIGDIIEIREEEIEKILKENSLDTIIPEKYNLDIVMENDDFLVINKPKGIAVHPGIGNLKDTLANYVVGYLNEKGEYDSRIERGGIVHRLDKSVSGLIIFAKNLEAQRFLQKQFEEHTVNKIYMAKVEIDAESSKDLLACIPMKELNAKAEMDKLVANNFEIDESWYKAEGYIGRSKMNRMKMIFKTYPFGNAKYALSYIKPLSQKEVLVMIKTGRMYQIRATLEYLGINIVGDTLFETFKGGRIPEAIELESVLLSMKDTDEKTFVCRLI